MGTSNGEDSGRGAPRPERAGSSNVRIGGLALVVALVWASLLFDPVVGPTLFMLVGLVLGVLAIAMAAMALGWVGIALFAAGDRLLAWARRASRWPEE